jgi:hypothetical protein
MVEFWFGDPTSMVAVFSDPGYIFSDPEYVGRLRLDVKLFLNLATSDYQSPRRPLLSDTLKVGRERGEVTVHV